LLDLQPQQLVDIFQFPDVPIQPGDVLGRHRQDFGVLARLVLHAQQADRPAGDDDAGHHGHRHHHHHVRRVAIAAQRVRDVAVVAGVVHGGLEHPVQEQCARILVDFVFHRRAVHRDFDDDVDVVGHIPADGNILQAHEELRLWLEDQPL
jgi:hypothetical protein